MRGNDEVEVTRNLKQAKPNEPDSHFRGNDEVEVTRNLKQAKPNEPDSRFRGNDEFQVAVFGFLFL
ncbi:pilus assembly protein PilS [Neisseria meningitidis]|nr:pilus assembly protein PilS [Neisseria meningitidis]